jgi:HEPN pEK499 p136
MEYFRTEDGQIQADFARRLGIVLKQYHQINLLEKYEVSLSLTILQSLLTNCTELLNGLKSRETRENPLYKSPINSTDWGFNEENIKFNSFYQPEITVEKIIRHIRNALSHPTKLNLNLPKKTTGFTTNKISNSIEKIIFVSSPDLNNRGNSKTFLSEELAKKNMIDAGNFPLDVEIIPLLNGKFGYQKDGEPFHRIFEIEFSPENLLTLTYSLSSYLSHPLTSTWDGITFQIQKIAA